MSSGSVLFSPLRRTIENADSVLAEYYLPNDEREQERLGVPLIMRIV